jgi:hypothetical protein
MDKVGKISQSFLVMWKHAKVLQEKCFFSHSQQEAEMVMVVSVFIF